MYLIGDIGGTKTRLALIEKNKEIKTIKEEKFLSSDFTSLLTVIRKFLKGEEKHVEKACFGIAGPIREGKCQATNLPWVVDSKEIKEELALKDVYLLNDLEANAYGIKCLRKDEFHVLNEGNPNQKGNAALISAGTGLGEAGLFWDGKNHHPFACEGSHADFAPRDELEIELFRFLRKKFGHVSYERAVSGPGLYNLYQFLVEAKEIPRNIEIEKEFTKTNAQDVITEKALKGVKGCDKALDLFISLYGSEAGNTALKFLALGGVYLGGGIVPIILNKLEEGSFMKAFVDKGRFEDLLMSIPVKVILNDKTAMLGTSQYIIDKEHS